MVGSYGSKMTSCVLSPCQRASPILSSAIQSYDKLESQTEVVAIPRQDHKTVHVVDHCCSLAVDGDGAVGVFALVVAHRVLVLYM